MNSKTRKKVAQRLLRYAKELSGKRNVTAVDVGSEFAKTIKATDELAGQFLDTHKDLIQQVRDLDARLKSSSAVLAAYYKEWKIDSGYQKTRLELLKQAQQCMEVGESLTDLSDNFSIIKRDSRQESYKEKFNVLIKQSLIS